MIKIAQKPTYRVTINGELPGDGRPEKVSFGLFFHRLTQEELDEMARRVSLPALDKDGNKNEEKMSDDDVVQRVVADFDKDVQDDNGNPLDFNAENLQALANI